MLDMILQVLSVIGIILLVLLGLLAATVLLVLLFPVSYRICGSKDEEKFQLSAGAKWLFGLVRAQYGYPESKYAVVKALWFTLYSVKIPTDKGEDIQSGGTTEENEDGKSGSFGKKRRFGLKGKSERKKARGRTREADAVQEKGELAKTGVPNAAGEGHTPTRSGNSGAAGEGHTPTESGNSGAAGEGRTPAESDGFGDGPEENVLKEDARTEKDGSAEGDGAGGESTSESAQTSQEDIPPGFLEKISQKFAKIKYTIYNIYDKIKKIWKNISYYISLLQEEETKQLFGHALLRLGKILKNIRPRRIKADILFGTGSPDTTGYIYGVYCVLTCGPGLSVQVTPDFERAVLCGEFELAGHITLGVLIMNGLRLLLDRKLRRFVKKMKM